VSSGPRGGGRGAHRGSALSFRQAEEYLLGLELFGMRFGLDRMHRLMTVLGLPQRRFASVHVVGTNGKSSTVRYIAAILQRQGLRTGSYTSPHLRSFRERVEVGEQPVSEPGFAAAVSHAAKAAELVNRSAPPDDHVTQFEALTAAAYHELARRGVEVAVIEAGLGGRFDATNVIPSKVQVLTNVGLEHTRWLGPTVREIAAEKLAVVRDHSTLVVGELVPEASGVAQRVAEERHARLIRAPAPSGGVSESADPAQVGVAGAGLSAAASASASQRLRPVGAYQRANFALAAVAAGAFLGRAPATSALSSAAAETRVAGRLDVIDSRPLTILDGAHNPPGAQALVVALPELTAGLRPSIGLLSVLEDKDAAEMLSALLPCFDQLVLTRCSNPRSLSPGTLEALAAKLGGPPMETVSDPHQALRRARELAGPGGAVLATGSIYLVADLVREAGDARASTL
jgi:dihydrofolate synthase / folylpolyglutamate synthase